MQVMFPGWDHPDATNPRQERRGAGWSDYMAERNAQGYPVGLLDLGEADAREMLKNGFFSDRTVLSLVAAFLQQETLSEEGAPA